MEYGRRKADSAVVMCPPRLRSRKRSSRGAKKADLKFVGPVIVYAVDEAVGIVNDHAPGCFRRKLALSGRESGHR